MQMILFLGLAFGLFVIFSLVGAPILSNITGVSVFEFQSESGPDYTTPNLITFMRGMILIQFLFLFVIPSLLFSYFSDPEPMEYLGLKKAGKPVFWLLSLLLIVVAFPFVEYTGYLNQKISFDGNVGQWMKGLEEQATEQIKFMLQNRSVSELFKNLLFIAVFAGVGEELFFRGILQRMFIRLTKNPWMGIILTAAIFSGIHFQFYGFFPRLLLGMLLGAIYWYSGSLWVAIFVHFFYDAAMILLAYFNPQMLEETNQTLVPGADVQLLITAVVSFILSFLLLRNMHRSSTSSYEAIYSDDFPPPGEGFRF